MGLLRNFTSTPSHVLSTLALTSYHIAIVVKGAARVTVTMLTSVVFLRQPPKLRQALVAVSTGYIALASAFPGKNIATLIVDRPKCVASARLAAVGVLAVEIPEAVFAGVTPAPVGVRFTVTLAGF